MVSDKILPPPKDLPKGDFFLACFLAVVNKNMVNQLFVDWYGLQTINKNAKTL